MAILFIVTSICLLKILKNKKSRKHYVQKHVRNAAKPPSGRHNEQSGRELIVKLNESPSSLRRNSQRLSHHQMSTSVNRLNIENTNDTDLNKPLLKKFVISRTNLNANQSGSEISESSMNNDENSKSTLLTGFSEVNNNNNNSNRGVAAGGGVGNGNANFLPVNNQICYF